MSTYVVFRFEESNMMRLSRKRKSHDAGRSNRQEMDDITDFSEFKSITLDGESDDGMPSKKSRKAQAKGKTRKQSELNYTPLITLFFTEFRRRK